MPESLTPPAKLRGYMGNFEDAVRVLAGHLGPPLTVTLCRSLLNGYLPRAVWPRIEAGVHQALRASLGAPALKLEPDPENPPPGYSHLGPLTKRETAHAGALRPLRPGELEDPVEALKAPEKRRLRSP